MVVMSPELTYTGSKDITVPKAPPLGLLLEQPQFAVYNERIKQNPGGSEVEREEVRPVQGRRTSLTFRLITSFTAPRSMRSRSSTFMSVCDRRSLLPSGRYLERPYG